MNHISWMKIHPAKSTFATRQSEKKVEGRREGGGNWNKGGRKSSLFSLFTTTTWQNKTVVNTHTTQRTHSTGCGSRIRKYFAQRKDSRESEKDERKRQRRRTRRAQTLHCILLFCTYKRIELSLSCVCYVCERERERETTTHTHKHTLTVLARVREKDTAHTASTEPPVPLLPTLHTAPVSISLSLVHTHSSTRIGAAAAACLPAWVCAASLPPFVRSFAVTAVVVVVVSPTLFYPEL